MLRRVRTDAMLFIVVIVIVAIFALDDNERAIERIIYYPLLILHMLAWGKLKEIDATDELTWCSMTSSRLTERYTLMPLSIQVR